MYIVRKISKSKWEPKPYLDNDEISADAITADLRTSGNRLSVWRSQSKDLLLLQEVALAIASNNERPDKLDIAYFLQESLEKYNIELIETEGKTPLVEFQTNHLDIINIGSNNLIIIAQCFTDAIRNKKQFHRFNKNDVIKLLKEAIRTKKINYDKLPESMKRYL